MRADSGKVTPDRLTEEEKSSAMMKTLFLQPPSFDGFDGGAGSRYQAQARDQILLVPDLAGPAGRPGARLHADRRAAGAPDDGGRAAARQDERPADHPHLHPLLRQ